MQNTKGDSITEPISNQVMLEVAKVMNRYLEGSLTDSEACMMLMIGIMKYKNEIIQEFDVIGK